MPKVSEQTGLSLDLLNDLHNFYWSDIYRSVASAEHLHVMVTNLGTFSVKGDIALDKQIDRILPVYNSFITNPPRTAQKKEIFKNITKDIDKLESLKHRYLKDLEKKRSIKKQRSEIRKAKGTVEKEGPDPGRSC